MKKILSFLMVALFSASMFADTQLYLRVSSTGDNPWSQSTTNFAVWYWGKTQASAWSEKMTAVEGEDFLYTTTIPDAADTVIFARLNGTTPIVTWDSVWSQTVNLVLPTDGKNKFTITSGGWGKECNGEWSVYTPTPKFKVAGSMNGWDASKNPSYKDTLVLALEAGDYQFKVVDGSDWKSVEALTDTAKGLYNIEGNIAFTLAAAGDVKIIYKADEIFKVEGVFSMPIMKMAGIPNWTEAEYTALVPDEDYKTAKATVNLTGDYYEFKLIVGANWLSRNGDGEGYDSLYTIHKDWNYIDGMKNGQRNIRLVPNVVPGNYTFTYDLMTGKMVVTFPEIPYKYYIAGTMTNWKPDSIELVAGNADTMSVSIPLLADSLYKFKVVKFYAGDTTWYGNMEEATMVYGNSTGWYLTGGENVGLQTKQAANYEFIFKNDENHVISVVYPAQPKYYVTGDSAFLKDAGSESAKWDPRALAANEDTLKLNLKAMQPYKFKVLPDGTWNNVKGYDELSVKPEGVTPDTSRNICFTLAEAGQVNIIYNATEFKVEGNFYAPKKTIKLVPNMWAADNAKMAAWIWGNDLDDQWTAFFAGTGDTLSVQVPVAADSIVFARFSPKKEAPDWAEGDTLRWNSVASSEIDNVGLTYTITDWYAGQWEVYVPVLYYVTGGEDIVGEGKTTWNITDALVSYTDTLTLKNLAAGEHKFQAIVKNGDLDVWKGFAALTDTAAGLYTDEYGNICFKLADVADVQIVYNADVYKVIGPFVLPVKFKISGSMTGWSPTIESYADSYTFENLKAGDYQFKVVDGSDWLGVEALTDTAKGLYNVEGNIAFTLATAGDVVVTYIAGEQLTVTGAFSLPTIKLPGIPDWTEEYTAMVPDEDLKTAKVTVNLTGDYYEFKLIVGANWLSRNGDGEGYDSLYTIHKDWNYVDNMKNGQRNMRLVPNNAGDYTFTYDVMAGKLTVTFPPVVDTYKYYIAGKMTNWKPDSIELTALSGDTLSVSIPLLADSLYEFKVVKMRAGVDTIWYGNPEKAKMEYGNSTGWYLTGGENVGLQTKKAGNYEFIFKNDENHIISVVYPAPTYADGYYLVGQFGGVAKWDLADAQLLDKNELKPGEYYIENITLTTGDSLKIAQVVYDDFVAWYPNDKNYGIDDDHAGVKTIYFNPTYQAEWEGNIYIEPNGGSGVENTNADAKASKLLYKGVLIIEKNGVRYNAIGQKVR